MDKGTKVFKAHLMVDVFAHDKPYYLQRGEVSGIVVDGKPMVATHSILVSINGWHETEADAKHDAWRELVRLSGKLQAKIDTLRDEMLHDRLTSEEVTRGVA